MAEPSLADDDFDAIVVVVVVALLVSVILSVLCYVPSVHRQEVELKIKKQK
jgi:Na+-transporting NADH:ubiquinone oxidoreductase subunit NqrC